MRRLNLKSHQIEFTNIYQNINGFKLSKQARKNHDAPEYTYGEIELIPFCALLSQCSINSSTIFYDLGSGTGKAVLACSMAFEIKKACGIEIFKNLHQTARQQKVRLSQITKYTEKAKCITFINDDFLNANFQDANLIFINAAGFIGETWDKLNSKLKCLPTGVAILSASKKLTCDNFNLIKTTSVEMSWGVATVYIYNNRVC